MNFNRNLEWIQFILNTVGIDLTQPSFVALLHWFLHQSCQAEKSALVIGKYYEAINQDMAIVKEFLSNKAKDQILLHQDESYLNTPLHVACSLFSYSMTQLLLKDSKELGILDIKNSSEKTPQGIIEEELKIYKDLYVPSKERDFIIERLQMIKTLFDEEK